MASAKASNPQTWNRYAYVLNNPLRWVDPDGLEEAQECLKDDKCTITVKLNIIIDADAELTKEQKQELLVDFLAEAIARYGNSDIEFDVTVTEGSFVRDDEGNIQDIVGLERGAINVIATDLLPDSISPGVALRFEGHAVIGIAMNKADFSTLPHELTHVFLGDIYTKKTPSRYFISEFVNPPLETLQMLGIKQKLFRSGAKWFSVPPTQEANEPEKK